MYMMVALVLFGLLSLGTAYLWERRVRGFNGLVAYFSNEFDVDTVDISGGEKYTECMSHKWVMRNVVHGDYSKAEGSLSDFVGENTLMGTILIGVVMGSLPVLLVFVMFQSFVIAGASMVTVVAAVFVIRSPGEVGVSHNLLSYLIEQDSSELGKGDFAYTRISTNRIRRWEKTLLAIGIASLIIAPWGELLPDAIALALAALFSLFLNQVFLPVASFSFPLALILFICIAPLSMGVVWFLARWINKQVKLRKEKFLV